MQPFGRTFPPLGGVGLDNCAKEKPTIHAHHDYVSDATIKKQLASKHNVDAKLDLSCGQAKSDDGLEVYVSTTPF
jgi:hypothetical protein